MEQTLHNFLYISRSLIPSIHLLSGLALGLLDLVIQQHAAGSLPAIPSLSPSFSH